eukprot:20786-Heterococcus_DN1.PRE.1
MILQRARLLACRVPAPVGVSCSSAAGAARAFSASSIPGAGPGRGAQGASSSGERGVGARPGAAGRMPFLNAFGRPELFDCAPRLFQLQETDFGMADQQQQQQKSCCICCCSKSSSAMPSAGSRRSSRKRNLLCASTQRALSSLPVLLGAPSMCAICCYATFFCQQLSEAAVDEARGMGLLVLDDILEDIEQLFVAEEQTLTAAAAQQAAADALAAAAASFSNDDAVVVFDAAAFESSSNDTVAAVVAAAEECDTSISAPTTDQHQEGLQRCTVTVVHSAVYRLSQHPYSNVLSSNSGCMHCEVYNNVAVHAHLLLRNLPLQRLQMFVERAAQQSACGTALCVSADSWSIYITVAAHASHLNAQCVTLLPVMCCSAAIGARTLSRSKCCFQQSDD